MTAHTPEPPQEPLRDVIGRVIYEEPTKDGSPPPDWYALSEERREPYRRDADRIIPVVCRGTNPASIQDMRDALEWGASRLEVDYGMTDKEQKVTAARFRTVLAKARRLGP